MVPVDETSSKSPRSIIYGGLLPNDIDNPVFDIFCSIEYSLIDYVAD